MEAIDLGRPRDLGEILNACWGLYRRHFSVFAGIALAVVVPMDVLTLGIIDGYFTADFDLDRVYGGGLAYSIITPLVTTTLITAGHVHAVIEAGEGREPSAGHSLSEAGALFPVVLATILLVTLGTLLGFVLLIVPGVYLSVRWYVSAQAVVAEGRSPVEAMRRSGELVSGTWWRVFGIVVVLFIVGATAGAVLGVPITAAAALADSGPLLVLAQIALDTVTLSFVALSASLLFFDLRARKEGQSAPPPQPPAPQPLDRPEVPPGA